MCCFNSLLFHFAFARSLSHCVYIRRAGVCLFGFFSSDNFSVFVHNLFPYGRNLSFVCLHHFYSYDFSVRFQCVWFASVSEFFYSVWSVDCRLMLLWQLLLCSHPWFHFFSRSELMLPILNSSEPKRAEAWARIIHHIFVSYCLRLAGGYFINFVCFTHRHFMMLYEKKY